jgi:hypothetical protein
MGAKITAEAGAEPADINLGRQGQLNQIDI